MRLNILIKKEMEPVFMVVVQVRTADDDGLTAALGSGCQISILGLSSYGDLRA